MQKQYHELIAGRIYFGSAGDIQQIADEEHIDVVVDLREESVGCAATNSGLSWKKIPLADHPEQPQAELFRDAILAVVSAYHDSKKVVFHCGGGKGRTGTVAVGVLMELGMCKTLAEAEARTKAVRPVINIKAIQREALEQLYPGA